LPLVASKIALIVTNQLLDLAGGSISTYWYVSRVKTNGSTANAQTETNMDQSNNT